MSNSPKHITLCADDYALHQTVSGGIIHLASLLRINAVSCLVTSENWPTHAKWLQPYRNQLDVGLHFNLTEGRPLGHTKSLVRSNGLFRSLTTWLIQTHLGWGRQADIENELSRQLERFTEHWQRLPDFIDGHQYVHHLPVVRDALLNVYEIRLKKHHPYIRLAKQERGGIKPWMVKVAGSKALGRQLVQLHVPHNKTFSGIYPFEKAKQYRHYVINFLKNIADHGLIVCHPAFSSQKDEVAWAASRASELAYLESDLFTADCNVLGVQLVRFR